jgi:rhodanese-related sulfurtransferase
MKHSPGFIKLTKAARRHVREITAGAVKRKIGMHERFILVDVREDHEWEKSRIPGAIHISRGILERDIEALIPGKTTEIVLYCGGGYRSVLAAESLQRMGYRNVASMKGGWRGWLRLRGKTER